MKNTVTAMALALAATSVFADDKVTIEFAYPYSHLFDVTYEAMMPAFRAAHPNIEVKFRATYESYEDATNTVLREAVANNLPDVTMQGLNRQQTLVEKGIAQSLEPFIAAEADFEKEGYHQAMLSLSTFDEDVYGLPFSISLPVGYYNMDLLREGGITALPTNWDEVIAACKTMKSNGIDNPIFWGWNITGNWFMQALLWSQDKAIVEDGRVTMDSPEALVALEQMQEIFTECEMQNLEWKAALSSFSAGDIGMMFWSTSALGAVERSQGDFELVTGPFPGLDNAPLGLPAGGHAAQGQAVLDDGALERRGRRGHGALRRGHDPRPDDAGADRRVPVDLPRRPDGAAVQGRPGGLHRGLRGQPGQRLLPDAGQPPRHDGARARARRPLRPWN